MGAQQKPIDVALCAALAQVDPRTLAAALKDPTRIRSSENRRNIARALRERGHEREAKAIEKAGKEK